MTTAPASLLPADPSPACWWFGTWRLFEAEQRLQPDGGEPAALDRSAYGVLRYLLLHAGEVCTTEELLAAGWPGRVVSSNSVTKCVSRLRRLLGDVDAELIRLVHGYGYRLVSEVRYLAGIGADASNPSRIALNPGESVPHRSGWALQARLGRGGCGEVFSASSEDDPALRAYKFALGEDGLRALKREVALHRLLQEQPRAPDCVLALLDWNLEVPPFFVATPWMAAGSLSAWAERDARLADSTLAQRLEWSARLCEAVEALHAADIAHRDLKPENIYPVENADGGLHFLLGDLGAGAGLLPPGIDALGLPIGQATRLGHSEQEDPASPAHRYIAPEVLAGHAAGQRADVFALGVLCAQLIAGDLRMSLAPGWEERIGDPLLSEDLAEAAHIDPKRRLGSAGELAERLRSLEVRREAMRRRLREAEELASAEARMQRLRRRWRVSSAIAGSALLALSVSVWLGLRAETAQREAERNAERTDAVRDFFTEALLSQADPYGHAEGGRVRLVDAMRSAASQIDSRLATDAESAAEVHLAVGEAFEGWAEHGLAIEHSQRALRHLARVEAPPGLKTALAQRQLCAQARRGGQLTLGREACAEALRIEQSQTGATHPETVTEAAKIDYELGHCPRAVERLRPLTDSEAAKANPAWLGDALWFSGLCQAQLGHFTGARAAFERLLRFNQETAAEPLAVAWAHADYAEVLVIEGDFERALPLLEVSEKLFEERLGPEHVHSQMGHYQRARIALWSGAAADAIPLYRRALGVWEKRFGDTHAWSLYTRTELIWAMAAAGRTADARTQLQSERPRAIEALGERRLQRSFFAEAWARTALLLGDLDTAAVEIERMQQDSEASLPATHPRHALVHCLRGELALAQGDTRRAREQAARCEEKLTTLPETNYRRRWLAELQGRIEA